ncbi:MAG: CpaF family protein [Alphaproteobacteria bacterium]|nr:CpaF family protein [Alphaproteobacteria bacterium]
MTPAHVMPAEAPSLVFTDRRLETDDYRAAKALLGEALVDRVDFRFLDTLSREAKRQRVSSMIEGFISNENSIPLTAEQEALLKVQALDDLLGFGPLEVLLADPDVSDIMVNGHKRVYVEKKGRIYLSDIRFVSERHLLGVIQKIVAQVGRRIDESSPMVDARMPDGSRFNAIIPPLSLDGCLVSIRKFRRQKMAMSDYITYHSASPEMVEFLSICAAIRLNILISGGTGSGKTTLLNALSGYIGPGERVITIEDTAELQLHQPHVLRLETRPPNMEGSGEISQRQLVRNALRMRPDRIILGEIRGDEVVDVMAAMNTGHDGSMATIHANHPRDAINRLENLLGMSGVNLSPQAMRAQIGSALHMIVQLSRMRDGSRRIVQIDEMVPSEGGVTTRTLFAFKPGQLDMHGNLTGYYYSTGIIPNFLPQAEYYDKDQDLLTCLRTDIQPQQL